MLGQLDVVLSDYLNFFMPSMKLIEKVRDGAHVRKRFNPAQTPFQRVLASPDITPEIKQTLRERAASLNPAALMRTIRRLQRTLDRLATPILQAPPPTSAVDGDGLRKAGTPTRPDATFPQPSEIAHSTISARPTAATTGQENAHAFR